MKFMTDGTEVKEKEDMSEYEQMSTEETLKFRKEIKEAVKKLQDEVEKLKSKKVIKKKKQGGE